MISITLRNLPALFIHTEMSQHIFLQKFKKKTHSCKDENVFNYTEGIFRFSEPQSVQTFKIDEDITLVDTLSTRTSHTL